jgi:subtilisin family serine protease
MQEVKMYNTRTRRIRYMPHQVILTGPAGQVSYAASRYENVLRPIEGAPPLPLGKVAQILGNCPYRPSFADDLLDIENCTDSEADWVMALYQVAAGVTEEEAVAAVNDLRTKEDHCVWANPNWLTGYIEGLPHTGAGSPYGTFGSHATEPEFWGQWALEEIGLHAGGHRSIKNTGCGVRVGVFDTSPFKTPGTKPIGWISPQLTLSVSHPAIFDVLPVPPLAGSPPPILRDHGLAVAGLVHAVAPGAKIALYRVLNEHALGNLFVLAAAVVDFILGPFPERVPAGGGVINCSLGSPLWDLPHEVVIGLELVLARAHCLGYVIAAAAGNASGPIGYALPMEVPANFDFVHGVAATNHDRSRACFSNKGNLAAPGGDGVGGSCDSAFLGCSRVNPELGLISLVTSFETHPDGYAYCAGTSFATPLVAGQAALLLEAKKGALSTARGGRIPVEAAKQIKSNTKPGIGGDLGAGIIDVQLSLSSPP